MYMQVVEHCVRIAAVNQLGEKNMHSGKEHTCQSKTDTE